MNEVEHPPHTARLRNGLPAPALVPAAAAKADTADDPLAYEISRLQFSRAVHLSVGAMCPRCMWLQRYRRGVIKRMAVYIVYLNV